MSKDACPKGHVWTPENTRVRPRDGYKECRSCNRDRAMWNRVYARYLKLCDQRGIK